MMPPINFTTEEVKKRHFYTKNYVDMLAIWTSYFKDPVCSIILLYLHEEQFKELLVNGEPSWSKKMTVRTISVRLNIPKSTVHRKLNYMLGFQVFDTDGNNFRFRVDDENSSLLREELPEVGAIFDKIANR